jgi:hypothetical protein
MTPLDRIAHDVAVLKRLAAANLVLALAALIVVLLLTAT